MKRLFLPLALVAGLFASLPRAEAGPVPCIICGSTPVAASGIEGVVSFAVISGASFAAEVPAHAIGFFGLVPPGTLGPPVLPAPTDFVYLYQLVNSGASPDLIMSWAISGGLVGSASGAITAGTRLESTLFVDPNVGPPALITAGPVAAPTALGLSAGPLVDFENGLGDPIPGPTPPWGPCLTSGPSGVNCSDGEADLLLASVLVHGWGETPSLPLLDPLWSGSIIWFASPFAPGVGTTTITDASGLVASASVPVPTATPGPATVALLGLGLAGLAFARRRKMAD